MWTWQVSVALLAGTVLGYCLARWRHTSSGLDVDSTERKQMWIREGHL